MDKDNAIYLLNNGNRMPDDSWYRAQYNALRNAQIQETALSDSLYRSNIQKQTDAIKFEASQKMEAKKQWNIERIAKEAQANEANFKWGQAQTARNREVIQARYATIEVPNGNGGFTSIPRSTGGGSIVTAQPQSYAATSARPVTSNTATAPYEAVFKNAAPSPVQNIQSANAIPPQPQSNLSKIGGQVLQTGASMAGGFVGDYIGDRASEAVFGSSNGLGSQIGSVVGTLAGGIAGSVLTANPFGGAIGSVVGSSFGGFLGSWFDSLFGGDKARKSDIAASLGKNADRGSLQPFTPPFAGGQSNDIMYAVFVTTTVRYRLSSGSPIQTQTGVSEAAGIGAISDISLVYSGIFIRLRIKFARMSAGTMPDGSVTRGLIDGFFDQSATIDNIRIVRMDGLPDTGGNLPNLNPVFATNPNQLFIPPDPILAQSPPVDFGAIDVLEDGETYKQGTGFRDTSKDDKTPQIATDPNGAINPISGQRENNPTPSPSTNQASPVIQNNSSSSINPSNPNSGYNQTAMWSPRPFVGGVSDPSEQNNPRDSKTGLTYSEFMAKIQADSNVNTLKAKAFDAKEVEKQLSVLPNEKRVDLGNKSIQEIEREKYLQAISTDPERIAAYNKARQTIVKPVATPTPTPAPDVVQILGATAAIAATLAAVKVGSDMLVNNALATAPKIDAIQQQTTAANQQANAATGACTSLNSATCTTGLTNSIANPVNAKLDNVIATQGAHTGLLGSILAALSALASAIASNFAKLFSFLDLNAKIESVKSTLTLALTLHNALMLSQSLGTTLGVILDNVLGVFGNTFRDSNNNQISASTVLGATVQQWIINIVGADNYVKLSETFAIANRIYQTGMNIVSTVQSVLDSAGSAIAATGINVSKIGNALRDESVVSPKAYAHMDESALGNRATVLGRFEKLTSTVSDLDTKAQNLVTITAAPIQIKDAIKQSKDDLKAFEEAKDVNSKANIDAKQAKLDEIKALKPLTEVTVGKLDEDL